jgi:hypothetical protein
MKYMENAYKVLIEEPKSKKSLVRHIGTDV